MKTKSIIACLFLMLATQVVSAQNEGERIIRAMVEKMKSHKNVEMVFNFSINPNDNDLGETEKSHAWLQGEAYKIEMAEQQTISDGKTIWSYLIEDEEVIVSNASEGSDNTPLKVLTTLDESYVATLSSINSQGIASIELANPNGQYKRVMLKINAKKHELNHADIFMEDGSKIIIDVEEMKYDQTLDDKFFTFDAKKHPNVDVIDMR